MKQEEKDLLLRDLSARLPYGVKILHTGWDYDGDTDFDTVETLIGIDDRFIYTVWDKIGDREKHCLSVSNWKPYIRPMSSMTEEEKEEYCILQDEVLYSSGKLVTDCVNDIVNWLDQHHIDHRNLIKKGLAIEVTDDNNPYK